MPEIKPEFYSLGQAGNLMPQEEMLEIKKHKKSITIGVPKETSFQENRVALAPVAVGLLTQNGHQVMIETNAGISAHFTDNDFSEQGGKIVYSPEEVFKADLILKVAPPSEAEIEMLKPRQTLISAVHISIQNKNYFKKLIAKKITALGYEMIKDKTGSFPVVQAMSEIAGNTSVLIAAEYLCHPQYGKGSMLGGFSGITPTEVVIIGAGTVGEFAARAAMGLGALVKVFDNSLYKLRRLQNDLNTRIFTSIIQPKVLLKSLKTADVVIGALHNSDGRSPIVVTEQMVTEMKKGSVIIDVSIDQGGCVETSYVTNHTEPVFQKFGVTHYCVPNIPSKVPHTASYALSNFFAPILLRLGEEGGIDNLFKNDYGIRQGGYLYNGILTNKYIGEHFNLPYQDIELLMAAFQR
ncbi:MAG TPA: alanine dehydrogenase [Bacteroidales bacterium]|nr:alanine dehydrogenase [Bacteroidales bacterium]HPS17134.1 alanine dehydrogenase [Bacteroidales bacterium]